MVNFRNPKPIEIAVEDLNGQSRKLTCKTLTFDLFDEEVNATKDIQAEIQVLLVKMVVYFGGAVEDYKKFSPVVIKQILEYLNSKIAESAGTPPVES